MKKKAEKPKAGAPAWMTTWADLVSLLMCFFVMLFALSNVDEERFIQFAEAMAGRRIFLQGAMGQIFSDSAGMLPDNQPPQPPVPRDLEVDEEDEDDDVTEVILERRVHMEALAETFRTYMAPYDEEILAEIGITVDELGEYVRFTFPSGMLFASGQANLLPDAVEMIDYVAGFLAQFPGHRISIQGHTDDVPINTIQFPSNFRLSAARAEAVLERLIYEHGFDPVLLYPSGLGEFRPVDTNATPEGRANNRRVEILVHAPQQPSLTVMID